MSIISKIHFDTGQVHPFPFDIPAIRFTKHISLDKPITFFVGDNGTGKSTLLESIAFRLQLPHMDGSDYRKQSFAASVTLAPYFEMDFSIQRARGFFFRAEDFGDYLNSIDRRDAEIHAQLKSLHDDVPEHIIRAMRENANEQIHHVRKNFGQDLRSFSHGEAYLHIIQEKVKGPGIYLLDEPEAALSPNKQLALIYLILEHLKGHRSQFIMATHSPILMSIPDAIHYEITADGMQITPLDELEHYRITKSFLNHPEMYLRHL